MEDEARQSPPIILGGLCRLVSPRSSGAVVESKLGRPPATTQDGSSVRIPYRCSFE
jgi:hypothetical protein